jgi:hypothetical protein
MRITSSGVTELTYAEKSKICRSMDCCTINCNECAFDMDNVGKLMVIKVILR